MGQESTKATRGFVNRIAISFDFDRTLADGTFEALVTRLGVEDPQSWRKAELNPMVEDGWDEILAKGFLLARLAEKRGQPLTRDEVEEVGRSMEPYPGVPELLPRLRDIAAEASGGAEVVLHVLSSGFVDLLTASDIAPLFDGIWGSSLHWNEDGTLDGVKRAVIHSEKARYLLALAKGLDIAGANEPQDVLKDLPPEEWHVPLDQMIYVGDGASDLDAFSLLHDHGGIAIAINQSAEGKEWDGAKHMFEDAQVENLAPPDFREGSEMARSLVLAAEIVGKRVKLRSLAKGE